MTTPTLPQFRSAAVIRASACDHLSVLIMAIERAFSPKRKSRLVRGNCQRCTRDVRREITADEIKTGIRSSDWK